MNWIFVYKCKGGGKGANKQTIKQTAVSSSNYLFASGCRTRPSCGKTIGGVAGRYDYQTLDRRRADNVFVRNPRGQKKTVDARNNNCRPYRRVVKTHERASPSLSRYPGQVGQGVVRVVAPFPQFSDGIDLFFFRLGRRAIPDEMIAHAYPDRSEKKIYTPNITNRQRRIMKKK